MTTAASTEDQPVDVGTFFDGAEAAPTGTDRDVTVFAPVDGPAALYVGDALTGSGTDRDVLIDALVRAGATVVTSTEHLLGDPDGDPAQTLEQITAYGDALEQIETLRDQAAALLSEAAGVEAALARLATGQ